MRFWNSLSLLLAVLGLCLGGEAVLAGPTDVLPASVSEIGRAKHAEDKVIKHPEPAKKKGKKKKKKKGRKKNKKKTTPKKKSSNEPRYAIGLKGGLLPINDMKVNLHGSAAGEVKPLDYDFGLIWGWGVGGQYRLLKNFYVVAEIMYWFPKVDEIHEKKGATETADWKFKESDGLLNMGLGLRYNLLGGEHTRDRVYVKGHFGFTDYMADDSNETKENREGYYVNIMAGIEHKFSKMFTIYADGGYYYNDFLSASTTDGRGEDEAVLQGVTINAGFLVHWGAKK